MRVLLLHPRPDTLAGYYGLRAAAELLNTPATEPTPPALRVDVGVHADWEALPASYGLVHLSLRLLDYESDLLPRVAALRGAGVAVLVDVDAPLTGRSRLVQLRRQLCQLAGAVRLYDASLVEVLRPLLGPGVSLHVLGAHVPRLKRRRAPSTGEHTLVGVYPTANSGELDYLRSVAAYVRGLGGLSVRWVILGGTGWSLDQQQVSVVPQAAFSRALRAAGPEGLRLAARCYNPRHESLPGLLRAVPALVEIPQFPFVTVRQDQGLRPVNQTLEALSGISGKGESGTAPQPTPMGQLKQLLEVDALVLPPWGAAEEQGWSQLVGGLSTQLGLRVYGNPGTEPAASARVLARELMAFQPAVPFNEENEAARLVVEKAHAASLASIYAAVVGESC